MRRRKPARTVTVASGCLGHVPHDASVRDAVRTQAPFVRLFPDRPASRRVREIAARLLERPGGDVKGTLQFFIESVCSAAAGG